MPDPEHDRRGDPYAVPPPATDDLGTLMARVARGDEDAFGSFYDALSGAVFGLVRRVLRDPVRSEEVTQEVFLQVWQKAPNFDAARGRARTWRSPRPTRRTRRRPECRLHLRARQLAVPALGLPDADRDVHRGRVLGHHAPDR